MVRIRSGANPKVWRAVTDRAVPIPNCFGLDHFDFGNENLIKKPPIAKIFFSAPPISYCKILIIFFNDFFGQDYTPSKTFLWTFDSNPQHSNKNLKRFFVILNFIAVLFKFMLNFCYGHIVFNQHKHIEYAIELLGSMH